MMQNLHASSEYIKNIVLESINTLNVVLVAGDRRYDNTPCLIDLCIAYDQSHLTVGRGTADKESIRRSERYSLIHRVFDHLIINYALLYAVIGDPAR